MAAGLTVEEDKLEAAMARLAELLEKQGAALLGPSDLRLDGMLMPGAATVELIEQIEQAGPFGAGAPAPRYVFADMRIFSPSRVGETHLKISFGDGLGIRMDAIAFGAFDSPLGPPLKLMAARVSILPGGWTSTHGRDANPCSCAWKTPPALIHLVKKCSDRTFLLAPIRLLPKDRSRPVCPFVYRLGRQVFNLKRGVRLPYGLPPFPIDNTQ